MQGTQSKPKPYAESPQTIGEHLKRARLTRGLTQTQAGKTLGINPFTVINWEKGRTEPPVPLVPAILEFLGYDPYPAPQTLPERMLAKRRTMGWTVKEAARQFGVDEGTWGCWERANVIPWQRYLKRLEFFI
jgi:transcriptional regulator with XRE-family HTH domain